MQLLVKLAAQAKALLLLPTAKLALASRLPSAALLAAKAAAKLKPLPRSCKQSENNDFEKANPHGLAFLFPHLSYLWSVLRTMIIGALLGAVGLLCPSCETGDGWSTGIQVDGHHRTASFDTPPFLVDTLYASMQGPHTNHFFRLPDAKGGPLFLTGYQVAVSDADGTPQTHLNDYLCHTNMDFDVGQWCENVGIESDRSLQTPRLFTLTQGQQHFELPKGFGIPVFPEDNLSMHAQVLNLNNLEADLQVQHSIQLHYTT